MTVPIKFMFDIDKTVQVVAMILRLNGGEMHYLNLLKLLYTVDRLALDETNRFLTGDCYVSMEECGPVPSNIYDLIVKPQSDRAIAWKEHIKVADEDLRIELLKDPGNGELSRKEESIIEEVCANPENLFSEWRGESAPTKVEDMLLSLGKTEEDITRVRETEEREAYLDKLFLS